MRRPETDTICDQQESSYTAAYQSMLEAPGIIALLKPRRRRLQLNRMEDRVDLTNYDRRVNNGDCGVYRGTVERSMIVVVEGVCVVGSVEGAGSVEGVGSIKGVGSDE